MSVCKDCGKIFSSPQSLCNHRKRKHPDNTAAGAGERFADSMKAEKKMIANKAINTIMGRDPSTGKKRESDSDTEDSEDSDSGSKNIKVPKDKEGEDNLLTDYFLKLYSNFDEDDIGMVNDLLQVMDELKKRGFLTEREYADVKRRVDRQVHLNLYETIDSTTENLIHDDKREVLGLLRSMKKDEEAKRMVALVKDYFEKEMDFDTVLHSIPKLKDKVNGMKVQIILKQIQKTRDRVEKILTAMADGTSQLGDTLNYLRSYNLITQEQYDKLSIGPNTLPSISRIIKGRGMYLSILTEDREVCRVEGI